MPQLLISWQRDREGEREGGGKREREREREREGGGRILFVPLSLSLIGEGGGRCDSLIYRRQTHEFPE